MNLRYGTRVQTAIEIWVLVNGEKDSYVFLEHFLEQVSHQHDCNLSLLSYFGLSRGCRPARWKGHRANGRVIVFSQWAYKESHLLVAEGEGAVNRLPRRLLMSTWLATWELS